MRTAVLGATCAGNYGFDPLGLAKTPESLARFRESELVHCRWSMLGVVGALSVELLGFGNWADAPLWVSAQAGGRRGDAYSTSGTAQGIHDNCPWCALLDPVCRL